ncbi:peptide deformylase [Legionella worsleiensis]|uniref:Peptide deformylase n=1 Tax=Legionella worsleiensis TaxID=45076 RepID=A0A0W1A9I0_9GAMM|nr:peptide deformylase [Legionella worsleiensis]KTD77976.1 Peptide deformylase [Legionella worsleiensis]STY31563.1 Peptide deformylase [Legionella worsleiensis]
MKLLPLTIFSEFKNKVLDTSYYPIHPLETLKARLTAAWLLQSSDFETVRQAKTFILKTSLFKEDDLLRLEQLASQVQSWDELQICSTYTNTQGIFLEYKLLVTTEEYKQELHFHAQYKTLDKICCFVSQTTPLIRVTGDPILQKPGIYFPDHATLEQQEELTKQIEHAKSVLIQTGGAGIAANQCAAIQNPYRFTIVGVFHDIPEHTSGVAQRYPGTKFPQAMVMVNPIITAVSKETQKFNHACLSVPCPNRCTVISPIEMSVTYKDPLDALRVKEVTLTGVDAVVLWHELTHIIDGKTYMDVTFDSLAIEDLIEFKEMMYLEIQRRQNESYAEVPEISIPPFHFSVKVSACGSVKLDSKELAEVLPKMTNETLSGLLIQASIYLKKKQTMNYRMERVFYELFFASENKNLPHSEGHSPTLKSKL